MKFTANQGVAFAPTNTCAQPGGSLAITEVGHVDSTFSYWSVPTGAPAGGRSESVAITGSTCGLQAGSVAFAFTRGWPAPACNIDQLQRFQVSGLSLPIWIYLGCDGNYQAGCEAGPSVHMHYIATTEVDPVAPTLTGMRGSLLSGGVIRGHQTIGVDAHDEGGGLSEISISVNGLPAAQPKVFNCAVTHAENDSVYGTVTASVTPCPTDGAADWNLDTQAYPFHNGTNNVEVCTADFSTLSEPNTTCAGAEPVTVDNSCTPSDVSGGQVLSAEFPASGTDSVTVPFDRGAEVDGKLSNEGGDPIPGATLCVKMQIVGVDRQSSVIGTVKTDASGHYTYAVAPGPNREVTVGYRNDAKQLARGLNYHAHSRPTLRLVPPQVSNGRPNPDVGHPARAQRRGARRRPAGKRGGLDSVAHLSPRDERGSRPVSGRATDSTERRS